MANRTQTHAKGGVQKTLLLGQDDEKLGENVSHVNLITWMVIAKLAVLLKATSTSSTSLNTKPKAGRIRKKCGGIVGFAQCQIYRVKRARVGRVGDDRVREKHLSFCLIVPRFNSQRDFKLFMGAYAKAYAYWVRQKGIDAEDQIDKYKQDVAKVSYFQPQFPLGMIEVGKAEGQLTLVRQLQVCWIYCSKET